MPRFLVRAPWLLSWLCLSSLAHAQWAGNGFGPTAPPTAAGRPVAGMLHSAAGLPGQFGSGMPRPPALQTAPQCGSPPAWAGALPLPPLPPEIEAEAVYLPAGGACPPGHAQGESPAWPQPPFQVQQAACWQPSAPNVNNGAGMPYAPYVAQPIPFARGEGIQQVRHEIRNPPATGAASGIGVGPNPGPSPAEVPWNRPLPPQAAGSGHTHSVAQATVVEVWPALL